MQPDDETTTMIVTITMSIRHRWLSLFLFVCAKLGSILWKSARSLRECVRLLQDLVLENSIVANFMRTVADLLSSRSSGSNPLDVAAVAARPSPAFSSSPRGPTRKPELSSTPASTLLESTLKTASPPPGPEEGDLLASVSSTSGCTVPLPRRLRRAPEHLVLSWLYKPNFAEASRLDARRNSLSDHERPWTSGVPLDFSGTTSLATRRHTP